tara:strand:+ start:12187 stop:12837 length:651 start_codon:yes stop_codon:yes gene_type:complete
MHLIYIFIIATTGYLLLTIIFNFTKAKGLNGTSLIYSSFTIGACYHLILMAIFSSESFKKINLSDYVLTVTNQSDPTFTVLVQNFIYLLLVIFIVLAVYLAKNWPKFFDGNYFFLPNNELLANLTRLMDNEVVVTLDNNKIYFGELRSTELNTSIPYEQRIIKLGLIQSGTRDSNGQFIPNVDYDPLKHIEIYISLSNVISFSKYSGEGVENISHT